MTPEERKRKAGNYAAMMASDAWKDLVKWAEDESRASMKRIDDTSAADLIVNTVCEERGIRKGILKVLQHAEFCREGV